MEQHVEFRSGRTSSFFTGLGLLIIPIAVIYLTLWGNEDKLLNTHVRRGGGFIKLIEQTVGWEVFCVLMLAFGAWGLVYSLVCFWKAVDGSADVTAFDSHLEFHPAVKRIPVSYDDVSHWRLEFVSGHPVLWINLHESYWSLQGLFKRKTIKLEGAKEDLEGLFNFFAHHPVMKEKFVRS